MKKSDRMKMEFEKISGAKNIFLFTQKTALNAEAQQRLIKKVCDPYEGFFADGVVFMEQLNGSEFKWHFFNSDGSSAEMCGNAARCAHKFIQLKYGNLESVSIQTLSGKITSTFKNNLFHVQMTTPNRTSELKMDVSFFESEVDFTAFKKVASADVYFADTGVPHLVIPVSQWDEALKLKATWLFLRKHKHFEKGTNVTLVQNQNDGSTKAISFERGVDDFTQACGTGATAAALYVKHKENKKLVTIAMPGGQLRVDLNQDSPVLIGEAVDIGQVIVNI
tara:strand:- start:55232 stop:56068 length:837 start_codon:yes stop_codon:yes gene_type:complete